MSKLFVETNKYSILRSYRKTFYVHRLYFHLFHFSNQKHQIAGKCKNLSELFLMGGRRDLKTFYDNEILNYKREYSKWWVLIYFITWAIDADLILRYEG